MPRRLHLRGLGPLNGVTLWALRARRFGPEPALLGYGPRRAQALRASSRAAFEVLFVYLGEVDGGAQLVRRTLDAKAEGEVREVAMGIRQEWEREAEARGVLQRPRQTLLKQLDLSRPDLEHAKDLALDLEYGPRAVSLRDRAGLAARELVSDGHPLLPPVSIRAGSFGGESAPRHGPVRQT